MNYKGRNALKKFKERCFASFGEKIVEIQLFGSRARQNNKPDSDFDLFVVVNEDISSIEDKIIDIAFDINLKYGIYISPRVVSISILNNPLWKDLPFFTNVKKEGIPI